MMGRATAAEPLDAPLGGDRDLASLLRLYEDSRSTGQGRVAFVHGPSGVGKTHLLTLLKQRLAAQGVRVFVAGTPGQARGSYGLLRQLVPELLAHVAESGVPTRVVSDLQRRTLPLRGGQHAGGEDPALDLADAVAELCSLAGRSAPAFLLTDLDAADRASLELLRYVLATAQAPGARSGGLFVLGYRDDAPLPAPLSDLVKQMGGLSISLAGLDLDGIRAFLARREVAERLLNLTHGNPAVLEQVIRAAPDSHPEEFFLQRVRRLGRTEQDALAALSVAGTSRLAADLASVLVEIHGQAPLDLESRLRFLIDARLLTSRAPGAAEPIAFAREADRETLYRSLPEEQRRPLHAAWGRQLRQTRGNPEEVAQHFLASGDTASARQAALDAGRAHQLFGAQIQLGARLSVIPKA